MQNNIIFAALLEKLTFLCRVVLLNDNQLFRAESRATLRSCSFQSVPLQLGCIFGTSSKVSLSKYCMLCAIFHFNFLSILSTAICIEAFENKCRKKKANPLESVKTFELLFDGERNISFKKKHSKEEATANYSKKDEVREDDSQGAKNVESNVQNDDTGQTLGPELTTKPIAAVGDSVS